MVRVVILLIRGLASNTCICSSQNVLYKSVYIYMYQVHFDCWITIVKTTNPFSVHVKRTSHHFLTACQCIVYVSISFDSVMSGKSYVFVCFCFCRMMNWWRTSCRCEHKRRVLQMTRVFAVHVIHHHHHRRFTFSFGVQSPAEIIHPLLHQMAEYSLWT